MKLIVITSIFVCSLGLATVSFGSEAVKVGYVDIQKILVNSDAGKKAKEQLDAKGAKYEAEKNSREEELKRLKSVLEKQSMLLSEETRNAKEKEYQQKLKEYQRFLKDAQDDLQANNDELINRIVQEILRTAQSYGRSKGYTCVFAKNNSMVYVDDRADLTDQILQAFKALKQK